MAAQQVARGTLDALGVAQAFRIPAHVVARHGAVVEAAKLAHA